MQLTKRYQSRSTSLPNSCLVHELLTTFPKGHNQSARFNTSDSTTIQPSISARQQASPPPQIVSGSTTIHAGGSVSTSTLPFLSHHPMPPIPAGTPPLSRSASPAVTASSNALRAPNAYSSASGVAHPHLSSNQQPQQQGKPATQMNAHIAQENQARPQSVNRTWTNLRPAEAVSSTAGWLANLAGLGK